MARIRSLKPSFFTDSELAALPALHRIAFQGLWCHADKAGRLDDKPRELKVKVLPFDDCDFDAILDDLSKPKDGGAGFIVRYQVGAKRYIAVSKWEHQHPHHKEPDSLIPGPDHESALVRHWAEPVPAPSQPVGFLSLGSGFLSLGAGVREATPPPPSENMDGDDEPTVKVLRPELEQGPPLRPSVAFVAEAPGGDPENWTGEQFWAWLQAVRAENGCIPERPPNPGRISAWWSVARMTPGVSTRALKNGFYSFGESEHWQRSKPKWPFAGFISQWEQFTQPEEAENETKTG